MKPTVKSLLVSSLTMLTFVLCTALPAAAQQRETSQMDSNTDQVTGGWGPPAELLQYAQRYPLAANQLHTSYPGGKINYGEHGETGTAKPTLTNPGTVWPEVIPAFPTQADELTTSTANQLFSITGVNNPTFGAMPATALGVAVVEAAATQMTADYESNPQNAMARAREEQNQANQTSADTNAQMERNQAGAALDFCASYLYNFTVEANNKWNRVRNELFLPMALLLLLPGVVLAQLKATVSAGTPVIADITSPFDGILRAIVGIFLIPATYLFINYGIDVANSITYTISQEYHRIFGTDMYRDAMCAHIRAFPYRNRNENKGYVPNQPADMSGPIGQGSTSFARFEGQNLEVALRDPCAHLNQVPGDRTNEQVPHVVNAQRNAYNTANSALAMTWNILCAFQMAYLYYLWFVGPVIAALWVYPMKELRDAFPAWINGVCTICFWSLFWNTTILLMACCRGVDETGTLIMSALNFLSTACVKFAFDFAGLVKAAGQEAAKMAEKGGAGGKAGASGAQGQKGADASGGHTAPPSYTQHGQQPAHTVMAGGEEPGSRSVASITPGVSLDSGTATPTGEHRGLTLSANPDGGGLGLDRFEYEPPPINAEGAAINGRDIHPNMPGLGEFNFSSIPYTDATSALGAVNFDMPAMSLDGMPNVGMDGAPGADGASVPGDGNGNGIPDDQEAAAMSIQMNEAAALAAAGGIGAVHVGMGEHPQANFNFGDVNNANSAVHINNQDFAHLFANSPQAQAVRDQLMSQMQQQMAAGGTGSMTIMGDSGSGASASVNLQQLQAAFAAADAASAAGDSSASISSMLGNVGVDLPAVSFSGLNMSPIDVASIGNNVSAGGGAGGGFLPPSSDPTMARTGLDPQMLAGGGMIPLTGGQNGGIVPPNIVAQDALSRISSEIATKQAEQSDNVKMQAQQYAQAALEQRQAEVTALAQSRAVNTDMNQQNTGFNQGPNGGMTGTADPAKEALATSGMIDQLNATPQVAGMSGADSSPVGVGGLDTSNLTSYATSSALAAAQGGGITSIPTGSIDAAAAAAVRDPNIVAASGGGTGGGGDAGGGGLFNAALGGGNANAGAGVGESAGAYLSRTVGEQWNGKDGFENRMVQASIDDQQRARDSVNSSLTYGNTLQGAVQGTVYGSTDGSATGGIVSNTGTGGYLAASPAAYTSADTVSGGGGGNSFANNNNANANNNPGNLADASGAGSMNPLAKESVDQLAKTFEGFVPDVQTGGSRSGVEVSGLGNNSGGGITYDATGGTYAQNSAINAANAVQGGMSTEQRLPANQQLESAGGFVASAPRADAGQPQQVANVDGGNAGGGGGGFFGSNDNNAGGQPQQFDKAAYLSNQVGEQWRQYDRNVDAAIADQYKQQMNGAVESTYSRASGSMQDNVTGQPSQLPNNVNGLPQQQFVASNDASAGGMTYSAPAPASGSSLARESTGDSSASSYTSASASPAAGSQQPSGSNGSGGSAWSDSGSSYNAYSANNEEVRRQMDQLAQSVDYTPEVNLARSSNAGASGGDAGVQGELPTGVPAGVPMQGLQYFAQQSYQQPLPDSMQQMQQQQLPQQQQQLPTQLSRQSQNDQPGNGLTNANSVNAPSASVPVPLQLRSGNVANNRADALKNATNTRAKESLTGGGNGGANGDKGKTNRLSSALGKAASANGPKKAPVPASSGPKTMKDPMGTVASGSTLRRLRQKRKWSQEEIEAFKKLAGNTEGLDNDWDI